MFLYIQSRKPALLSPSGEKKAQLVEAPAPSPGEHSSVLGNAYCGYAILQTASLHNIIYVSRVVLPD